MADIGGEIRCPTCNNWAYQTGFTGAIICHHCAKSRPDDKNEFDEVAREIVDELLCEPRCEHEAVIANAKAEPIAAILRREFGNNEELLYRVRVWIEKAEQLEAKLAKARKRLKRIRDGECDCADFENREDLSLHSHQCPRRISDVTLKETGDENQ